MRFAAAALLIGALVASGCGGGGDSTTATAPPTAARSRPSPPPRGPVPPGVRSVESSAEDTIDFALAGARAKAVATARALEAAAHRSLPGELRKAGVSPAVIADFRARADRVAQLAPKAQLLQVALASNHAFAMVAGFFARYRTRVPAQVTALDYLDYEAKLRARAGDAAAVRSAAATLDRTWGGLRTGVVAAGGARVARGFDAHVRAMRRLAAGGDRAATQREAQHGLDLVDAVEHVYSG